MHEVGRVKKILVIGSLNMDLVVRVDALPQAGETVPAASAEKFFGGKGANQAVASAKYGAETYMMGAVGNDAAGIALLKSLKDQGINIQGIKTRGDAQTGAAWIIVDRKGENSIIVSSGANGTLSKEDLDQNETIFHEADIILIQLEIPRETAEYAICKGKENGCLVILNPAPAVRLNREIFKKIDIITPNETELDLLTSRFASNDRLEKAKELISYGVGTVICTLGAEGALFVNKSRFVKFDACQVDPVDTTGAGDCFNGVLAAELAHGHKIEEAIKSAIKAAAICVTKKGAQSSMPNRRDVDEYR